MFGSSSFYSKNSFLSIQYEVFYKKVKKKCWGICENFSFVEVIYEYVMVVLLKQIYRADTIAWSIFFFGCAQVPVLERP